jgi:trypsin
MGRIRVAVLACLALVLLAVVPAADAQSPEPRVVGGHTTTIEQYPWQTALVISPDEFPSGFDAHERQFCGGSLITRSIVLTAAHCVADGDPNCVPATCEDETPNCTPASDPPPGDGTCELDPDDVDVVLGVTTLSTAGPGQEHLIQDVSFHPDFDEGTFQNDVGYLVLDAPVTLGAAVAPIDIAGGTERDIWDPGVLVEVSGWGTMFSGGSTVDTLRAASVPIVADTTCDNPDYYGTEFDPLTMVCAGLESGGVDTCQGDSGGPLEAPLEGGGYRLVGITSWGIGCAQPKKPGVYARIGQGDPVGLRDDVVRKVDELEETFTLPDEEIVGNNGQPRITPAPASPGSAADGQLAGAAANPTPTANDPFLKCQKLHNKKKRRKCFRKVRASL